MINPFYLNGSSSLIFIISTADAIKKSNLFWWKYFNGQLILVSFLCNANEYKNPYLFYDYVTLFLMNYSYINNDNINKYLLFASSIEYTNYESIEYTKNLSFLIVSLNSLLNTYLYVNKQKALLLLGSIISGSLFYSIRYYLNKKNNKKYNLLLTYLFHLSMLNSLCISNITACNEKQILNILPSVKIRKI